ncbi:hypothetical protein PHIZP2_gp05 [Clostridium phage phiZP2]|uniref:Uncharacterized protein n=1 Tax=Clostridium phage phiZP2 TaxID=1162306 RepID=I3PV63_9CAUD|nr:hypothetical protein PHIZP2_gp05 [Clostridium phage phiZP2]AFH27139.1 hypothetical protein phiZP2_005 [Clostridium phage phiZP2]
MLVKSKTHICPSVPKGCIVKVLQEREGAYKIQYMNINSKKVVNAWVDKSGFEPVNDICGVTVNQELRELTTQNITIKVLKCGTIRTVGKWIF